MEQPKTWKIYRLYRFGFWFLMIGALIIYTNLLINLFYTLSHTAFDVVPADQLMDEEHTLLYTLILVIGIPAVILLGAGTQILLNKSSRLWHWIWVFAYICTTTACTGSLLFGGGWYIGTALADGGAMLLLYTILQFRKRSLKFASIEVPTQQETLHLKKNRSIVLGFIFIALVLSTTGPFYATADLVPEPLIAEIKEIPAGITPNHANTFYILPIWEWQGDNYAYGIQQLEYIKTEVGGNAYNDSGFVRIGRSVSCWYTNTLYANGSYDPTMLIHTLNMSTITNTPILFHMNGGNWGQGGSQHPIIKAMRENVSNCQWDQQNNSHPIKYNNGPNDRFWSFWPDSDWEHFRERNIKQALAVIYAWWQQNPDLLVGFSTDSEIHLNYNDFWEQNNKTYRSYFDYNNGTIAQYRQWAQANWTLDEFNDLCDTSFTSWSDVDAPRADDVVGKIGHSWWETWTDFRIWHVKEAGRRQSSWINQSGFPREMIWHHQIFSEPGDEGSRYKRCDPLETAINEYCKVGVTRYGWFSPAEWASLGNLSLHDGSGDPLPSWGIFEWNLWTQHEYWAYKAMLNCIYQYGGHVICPNEWANCTINEGLWIPGVPCQKNATYVINGTTYGSSETGCTASLNTTCCVRRNETGQCIQYVEPHGNPQFIQALRDFVTIAQTRPRGSHPDLRVNRLEMFMYENVEGVYEQFTDSTGLYIMGGIELICLLYLFVIRMRFPKKLKNNSQVE